MYSAQSELSHFANNKATMDFLQQIPTQTSRLSGFLHSPDTLSGMPVSSVRAGSPLSGGAPVSSLTTCFGPWASLYSFPGSLRPHRAMMTSHLDLRALGLINSAPGGASGASFLTAPTSGLAREVVMNSSIEHLRLRARQHTTGLLD